MSLFKGKVALVTGGHRDFGLELCKKLLSNGLKGLVITGRNADKGQHALRKLSKIGEGKVHFLGTDISTLLNYKRAFDETIKAFNQLDMLIHTSQTVDEYSWEQSIRLNLLTPCNGTMLAMKKYLPRYRSGKEGLIVNVTSIAGIQPIGSLPVFSSAKAGVIGLVRSLGNDHHYKQHKCRVVGLCIGLINNIPFLPGLAKKGVDLDLFDEETCDWPKKEACQCGDCLIKIISEAKNGSVWVAEGTHFYEWNFPAIQ